MGIKEDKPQNVRDVSCAPQRLSGSEEVSPDMETPGLRFAPLQFAEINAHMRIERVEALAREMTTSCDLGSSVVTPAREHRLGGNRVEASPRHTGSKLPQ